MDPIVTSRLSLGSIALHEATDEDLKYAQEQIAQLEEEARALGPIPGAASVHHAMGRLFVERLGDRKSAAACFQNAFKLNPRYRPNLESPRAQAQILSTRMGETAEAARRVSEALQLSPEHPALLVLAIEASERKGD